MATVDRFANRGGSDVQARHQAVNGPGPASRVRSDAGHELTSGHAKSLFPGPEGRGLSEPSHEDERAAIMWV